MAEFVQTMKDWRRMCKDRSCGSCNLRDSCNIDPDSRTDADIQKIDTKVKIWAAEHPEPVYPTWGEWLHDLGLIVQKEGTFTEYGPNEIFSAIKKVDVLTIKGYQSIPADIASKLGIQPKEAKE